MEIKESVQHQFGSVAERYASSFTHAQGPDLDALVARADAVGPVSILDAACGTGHTALALAHAGFRTTALDLTEPMLEQGRRLAAERSLDVTFDRGDVENLPYESGSFDALSTRLAAHHFPNPTRAIAECLRVVRPGGTVWLSDVVSYTDPTADTFLQAIELLRDPSHVRDHRVDEWEAMFRDAGASPRLVATWPLYQPFDAWVERMQTPAPEVAVLQRLFDQGPSEARKALDLDATDERSFTLTVALLEVRKESAPN